jgi:hypothetical protein
MGSLFGDMQKFESRKVVGNYQISQPYDDDFLVFPLRARGGRGLFCEHVVERLGLKVSHLTLYGKTQSTKFSLNEFPPSVALSKPIHFRPSGL